MKVWLEDNVPSDLTDTIKASQGQYTHERQVDSISSLYNNFVSERVSEFTKTLESLNEANAQITNS
jgi:hypothetical protein